MSGYGMNEQVLVPLDYHNDKIWHTEKLLDKLFETALFVGAIGTCGLSMSAIDEL